MHKLSRRTVMFFSALELSILGGFVLALIAEIAVLLLILAFGSDPIAPILHKYQLWIGIVVGASYTLINTLRLLLTPGRSSAQSRYREPD